MEILDYIADYERLEGLDQVLDGGHSVIDVRGALREVALFLRREMEAERETKQLPNYQLNYQKDKRFSPEVRALLSVLSPSDERSLLHKFGLLDH